MVFFLIVLNKYSFFNQDRWYEMKIYTNDLKLVYVYQMYSTDIEL